MMLLHRLSQVVFSIKTIYVHRQHVPVSITPRHLRDGLPGAQRADAVVVGGHERRAAVEAQLPALRPAVVPHPARPPALVGMQTEYQSVECMAVP